MPKYSELEFNELAAKAETHGLIRGEYTPTKNGIVKFDPYNDLNQLMPLVWKHELDTIKYDGDWLVDKQATANVFPTQSEGLNKDPLQAIRDCLFTIWSEQ